MTTALEVASKTHPVFDSKETAQLEAGRLITVAHRKPPGVEVQTLIRCAPEHMLKLLTNYADMPQQIYALERTEVLRQNNDTSSVRFTMKLPFPIGKIAWTNLIQVRRLGDACSMEWTLIDGDLETNEGSLVMTTHHGQRDITYARYMVRVQSKLALPKSAERIATRWLLPKIVGKLRRIAESR